MKNALVVFARAPEPGKVKTRIAKTIGNELTAELYAAMLSDTLVVAKRVANEIDDCQAIVAYTPANAFAAGPYSLSPFWSGARLAQSEGDLGQRLLDCFAHLRTQGAKKIVVIGSDSPDICDSFMRHAFRLLEKPGLVLGGTADGGFYLLGASIPVPSYLFDKVHWSRNLTSYRVVQNAYKHNIPVAFATTWHDMDEFEDLQELKRRGRRSYCAVETKRWLRSHGLFQRL